ncbi:hypothetical protein [Sorangium cellulosum]|uniref:Uncharacterized protein n=1 Tax=Sorangium cellulosum So0157-2 TaxID=1254432 RepID=S4Y0S5_SORCE|nr:hypothetical protein [Sorangium cellulosum]AGP38359.1 hypothetical protein SCE1572_30070 [Sorangium cellulosum So0157-2]
MLLKLALVGASVLLSSLAARRLGHAVGGTIAGLPTIVGPIMGFVLLQETPARASAIALATLVCLPATIVHGVVFAWCATRLRWGAALLAANAAFLSLGAALLALRLPPPWACAAALLSPALGALALPRLGEAPASTAIPRAELACRVVAAMAMAWCIMRGAGVAPAGVSGLLLAVPITGNVLPCFTLPRHGAAAAVALLAGFARGLFGFAAFFVALLAALGAMPPAAAYGLAWLVALLAALSLRRLTQRARRAPLAGQPSTSSTAA